MRNEKAPVHAGAGHGIEQRIGRVLEEMSIVVEAMAKTGQHGVMAVEERRDILRPRGVAHDELQMGLRRERIFPSHKRGDVVAAGNSLVDQVMAGSPGAADHIEPHVRNPHKISAKEMMPVGPDE